MPRIGGASNIDSLNNYELSSSPRIVFFSRESCQSLPQPLQKPHQHGFAHDPQSLHQLQVRDHEILAQCDKKALGFVFFMDWTEGQISARVIPP